MSKVLINLLGFLAFIFWGLLFFGDSPFYILHACGFTFLAGLVAVFSEDSSGSYNSDDSSSYYYHQQNEENSSDYDDDDDIRQNRWDDDDDGIYDSRGFAINGKLREYER